MSLSTAGQNCLMLSYRYHWRSDDNPLGVTTRGSSLPSGCQEFLRSRISVSGMSHCSLTNVVPGIDESKWKWWNFFIPRILLKCGARNVVQSYTGTTVLPSSRETSCVKLHSADAFTTSDKLLNPPTLVFLYFCLSSPKLQSGANFVCPTTRKESVILVCLPVSALHAKYCTIQLFLFCPVQLSAWRNTSVSPRPWQLKKWWSWLTTVLAPLPQSPASSVR